MIHYKQGNLFDDDAEAFVNAVNIVGVMGAGIARQFKQRYPEMFEQYEVDCEAGKVQLGKMHVFERAEENPRYVINFPTLRHWKDLSKLSDIKDGLDDLVEVVQQHQIQSIAIPPLGCGVGGLKWDDVRKLIEQAFTDIDVHVHLYEPQ